MANSLKIGIDISQIVYGTGVSDYTINLVQALQKLTPELQLTLFGSALRRRKDISQLFPTAKTYPLPPTFLHYLWNILHIVPVENFIGPVDVFHASDWTQPPTFAPSVTTIHDLSPLLFPKQMGHQIVSVHKSRLRWVDNECAKIICVSKSTAVDMENLFPKTSSRIVIIPEALPSRFDKDVSTHAVTAVKSKWHLDDYIIAIGTPQPRKNYQPLIKSFTQFKDKYRLPEKLVIVGGEGWGQNLPVSPDIIHTGYLSDADLMALVKGSQALVLPSIYEGFGRPILVAWRQGISVSASQISSLPEVVADAGVLFNPHDEESIALGISQSIKDKKSLITASVKRLSLYNWDVTAKKTFEVYQSI